MTTDLTPPAGGTRVREAVRERYASAALEMAKTNSADCGPGCCGDNDISCGAGYAADEVAAVGMDPRLSLGCGNPLLLADLRPGQRVLDLGSGAGLDVLLSARRVSPGGHVYGLDMTDEMLAVANANKKRAALDNATFLKGTIEDIPLAEGAVDVVISNCVINLAEDKGRVLAEAYRVLAPGGRLAVSDMVELKPLPAPVKDALDSWAGCIAGTIPVDSYRDLLEAVGFRDIDIEVSREYAPEQFEGTIASAAIRATKPAA
ncbi:MAG: arsenite methyltransferase [Chloroflexota bacterium]|jgi:SAM-dependent methyltransferase|nr:arsenite methyltransferase [Chloroflexota bacterium]